MRNEIEIIMVFVIFNFIVCVAGFNLNNIRDPPSPRQLMGLTLNSETNKLSLFSGTGEANTYLNDIWEFEISTREWKVLVPISSDFPEPRTNYGTFCDSSTGLIYLFGGEGKFGYLNDLWIFNQSKLTWSKKEVKGDFPPPSSRFAQTTYTDVDSKLKYVICNGKGHFSWVTDVYR